MKRRFLNAICLTVFSIAFGSQGLLAQQPLTPQELRGKQIYLQGTSASGKDILAYIGDASLEVPGNVMACANCHGISGQGKVEGGINPSNVTWEALTKPYGVTHVNGRNHPPYTPRALELAVTRGLDPAGNKLLYAMPRYQMSKEDLDDLVVYLKRLGTDVDPGITENNIVIGTAFPTAGPISELSQIVRDVIAAVFAETNSQGGVYSRQLELKYVAAADPKAVSRADIEKLIAEEKVFALTGVMIAGAEKQIVPLLAEREVPLIGPLTLDPKIGSPLNRQVFYLLDGSAGQARALISFMTKKPESKPLTIAVVHSGGDLAASILDAVKDQSQKEKLAAPQVVEYASGSFAAAEIVSRLKANVTAVYFMGSAPDLLSLMKEAAGVNWFPQIFVQSGTATPVLFDAPAGFEGKVFCTFPSAPADQTDAGLKEFLSLRDKYKLPQKHPAAQVSAFSTAKILVEALKRAGKDLSRERLIQSLEGFYNYQTGLTPPITYGPNRRIGAMGAYVVMVDLKEKKFVPVSGWVAIN
jgi:ABC-type branched-subunit amino acid transport system substrate-binding protein